jgi:hypothetical protein
MRRAFKEDDGYGAQSIVVRLSATDGKRRLQSPQLQQQQLQQQKRQQQQQQDGASARRLIVRGSGDGELVIRARRPTTDDW